MKHSFQATQAPTCRAGTDRGRFLLEAGAGTGKTYALTALVLWFMLRDRLLPGRILCVTFTRAATAELRLRISSRLEELLHHARAKQRGQLTSCADPLLLALLEHVDDGSLQHLELCYKQLANAAIFTIDGFCQRLLSENALAGGSSFQLELVPDLGQIQLQVLADLLRNELELLPHALIQVLHDSPAAIFPNQKSALTTPESWLEMFQQLQSQKQLKLRVTRKPAAVSDTQWQLAYTQARSAWNQDDVCALLLSSDLKKNIYKDTSVIQWCADIESWLNDVEQVSTPVKALERMTPESLASGCKKGADPPAHEFFMHTRPLLEFLEQRQTWLKACGLRFAARLYVRYTRALRHRLASLGLTSHGDALEQLSHAIDRDADGRLASRVSQQFPVALIDEFQDTDPVQVKVFTKLLHNSCTYFIGDPRQAIYRFRGADISAYLKAASLCDTQYCLDYNWRSSPALVASLNALFQRQPDAFLLKGIPVPNVQPALSDESDLQLDSDPDSHKTPLRFWSMPTQHKNKPALLSEIMSSVADDISWLLDKASRGRARLPLNHGDTRPLHGGDIAVLVHSHAQGQIISTELKARGIPHVLRSRHSVLESAEAQDLVALLKLLNSPGRDGLLSTVLTGSLLGYSGDTLLQLQSDHQSWSGWQQEVSFWQELLQHQGAATVIEFLLFRRGGATRLPGDGSAERTLVNWQHLGELCASAGSAAHDPAALLNWLLATRDTAGSESHQLRLENEGQLVQVLTIHVSKGLEYAVVYCPTLALAKESRISLPILYHDKQHRMIATFPAPEDATFAEASTVSAAESLAEQIRLCYVAMTRARSRLVIPLPQAGLRGSAPSVLDWLLFGKQQAFLCASATDASAEIEQLPQAIACCCLDVPHMGDNAAISQSTEQLEILEYSRRTVDAGWRITSFSALSSGLHEGDDAHDREQGSPSVSEQDAGALLPRGAGMGTLLHELLEKVEFHRSRNTDYLLECCSTVLQTTPQRGLEAASLLPLLQLWLSQPLGNGLPSLSQLQPSSVFKELEFHLSTAKASSERIIDLLQRFRWPEQHGSLSIGSLGAGAVESFLTGFIDLVFFHEGRWHIVDYKSNHLGPDYRSYDQSPLKQSIRASSYWLQYLIYTLALDRLLATRVTGYQYELHMGGAHYLYLRGMYGPAGTGVYHDLVPADLIRALQQEMRHEG